MIAMRTILCPVDFSDATPRQVALAASLARFYGARLVLHHNLAALVPGAGVGWMWSADQQPLSQEDIGERLQALAGSTALGSDVALSMTEGPASAAVIAVSDAVDADLVVLSTHKVTTDDHVSVTARVLGKTHRSVLALHDLNLESHALRFDLTSVERQVTLVPTDLTPESRAAVAFAFELAKTLPLELHLVHFLPHSTNAHRHEEARAEAEKELRALIPADFVESTRVHVRDGDPGTGIGQAAAALEAACIVMGEHSRMGLKRFFSHDTSRAVLHEAPCPVWYVPGQVAA